MKPHSKLSAVTRNVSKYTSILTQHSIQMKFSSKNTPSVTKKHRLIKATAYSICSQLLRLAAFLRCTKTLWRVMRECLRTMQEISAQILEKWRLGKIVTNSVCKWLTQRSNLWKKWSWPRPLRNSKLFTRTLVSLLCIQHIILSQFTLLHSISPHFEINFNIIPMSVIFSGVISILLDCPTNIWYSVLLYCCYSHGRGRH